MSKASARLWAAHYPKRPIATDVPSSAASLPFVPPGLIVGAAILGALLVGVLLAREVTLGVGLLIALCYVPIVFVNLPLGLGLWVAIFFVERLPFVSVGPNAAGILVALAWIGTLASPSANRLALLRRHRGILVALALFLAWISLSVGWAEEPGSGGAQLWRWYVAGLLLVIVLTAISSARHARWLAVAFVAGATASVLLGVALETVGILVPDPEDEGRLTGGYGDPNDLAAVLPPAIVLAGALVADRGKPIKAAAAVIAIGALVFGLVATESRGGMVAAAAVVVAGVLVAKRRRMRAMALVGLVLGIAAIGFAVAPGAWERVTSFEDRGNGRSELWSVAWQMAGDHPIRGVGINNFRVRSHDYAQTSGPLEFAEFLTDEPKVVHNVYLELLAETGILGLVLFLAVSIGCLRAGWLAAVRFDVVGERSLATLSRAVAAGTVGMLVAAFFISNGTDKPLWLLLALGPALLNVAWRSSAAGAAS